VAGSCPATTTPPSTASSRRPACSPTWWTSTSTVHALRQLTHAITHIANHGAIPILTWEPQGLTTPDLVAGTKQLPLRGGTHMSIDDYLADFAAGTCRLATQTGQPILVRTLHEMNGNWFSWGQSYEKDGRRPNTDATYKQAW